MKKINKIVLTGGPCAGKSTILSALKDHYGDKVVLVREAARQLFSIPYDQGGPGIPGRDIEWSEEYARNFQKLILEKQMADEASAQSAAEKLTQENGQPVTIVCDRGILDGAIYMPGGREEFFSYFGLTLEECVARYDRVIHLNSLATDNPELYEELRQKGQRRKNSEEYISLDEQTFRAWQGHPKRERIMATESIDQKLEKVVEVIEDLREDGELKENPEIEPIS